MTKRFIASIFASVLLTVGFATGIASATASRQPPNPIWCGLWAGASLDVTNASECANGKTSGQNSSTTAGTYVALGDSVAAGLGLPPGNNATSSDAQCGRSPFGYPATVARNLNLPLVNLACSGATAGDLVTQQHTNGPNPGAQLDNAFASGVPQLITITAGANDVHWQDFLRTCYSTDCTSSGYTAAFNTYLVALQLKLHYALASIQARSPSQIPRTIVTGYYNPISTACSTIAPQLTPAEISWAQQATYALNNTIRHVTSEFSFVTYVPLLDYFTGHDACSNSPWVQSLQDAAPLHPTAYGQQAIANAISAATQ